MKAQPTLDENAACESCGRFGAYEFDGHRLCAECYEKRGSCCPEFGADDLWPTDEPKPGCDAHAPAPPERKPPD